MLSEYLPLICAFPAGLTALRVYTAEMELGDLPALKLSCKPGPLN